MAGWDTSLISWDHFLRWVTCYNEVVPGDASVQFILKLNRVRDSQFRETSSFTLASLIDTFQGSHCQLPHDKIYAFRGLRLAHDHIDGSIPVDYRKPLFEVYQDAIHFQNTASVRNGVERATEKVHFSAKRWAASTADHVQNANQLEKARGLNSKLMTLTAHPDDMCPFVGTGCAVGPVSSNARKGDLVCQFWNHGTCAVLRKDVQWLGYNLVGKSVLVSSTEEVDWEVADDKTQFTWSKYDGWISGSGSAG